jgi:hypothetical protein
VNHKRLFRLYREERLMVAGAADASGVWAHAPLAVPQNDRSRPYECLISLLRLIL